MYRIFEAEDLSELESILLSYSDADSLRENLYDEFMKCVTVSDACMWNKAVRICEALAIIGWGGHEAVEALKGVYFNGYPMTYFLNRYGESRFNSKVWHQTNENRNVKLDSQRNWIAKNPIWIMRGIDNCYPNTRPVIESIEKVLQPELDKRMRPELYGKAVNRIILNCSYSFFDNKCCKTNYIIADEKLKLKQKDFYATLLTMYSEREIDERGLYLRNRFTHGPFRRDTGKTRSVIVFEQEFSEQSHQEQKRIFCEHVTTALTDICRRLKPKVNYNFELMMTDFLSILHEWNDGEIIASRPI